MPVKGLSKRRLKKHLRYAAEGIATGAIASLALISATIVIVRLSIGMPIGHRVPFGCVLFSTILIALIYRLWHMRPGPERKRPSTSYREMAELSPKDKTKSA